MIDITTHSQVLLREAHFDTWPWTGGLVPVVCFEDETLIGFVHVFDDATRLIAGWQNAQELILARHAPAFRQVGEKAWNVYCFFLAATGAEKPEQLREMEYIEEDLRLTRKIARAGLRTETQLKSVLAPVLPISSRPRIGADDLRRRLERRLADTPKPVTSAFLDGADANFLARLLTEALP